MKFVAEFLRLVGAWLWRNKGKTLLFLTTVWLFVAILMPATVWIVRWSWSDGVVEPLGMNKYLGRAVSWLFAVPMAWFTVWLVSPGTLRLWSRRDGKKVMYAFVASKRKIAVFGIFALLILASLFQYAIANEQCVRVNALGEEETYDGPCEESKRVVPAKRQTKISGKTMSNNRIVVALRKRFKNDLLPTGEFRPWFLRKRANLDRIPWVNQETGQAVIFSCSDPDGTRLYIREGFCLTSETRRPVDRSLIELLYREAAASEQHAREEIDRSRALFRTAWEERRIAGQRAREEAARQTTCQPAQPAPATVTTTATVATPAVQTPPAEQTPAAVPATTPAPPQEQQTAGPEQPTMQQRIEGAAHQEVARPPWHPDELQKQFKEHLLPSGEFKRRFLRSRANLDRIPWVNQRTGRVVIFYCGWERSLRLYIWGGYCPDGERRERVTSSEQEFLYYWADINDVVAKINRP